MKKFWLVVVCKVYVTKEIGGGGGEGGTLSRVFLSRKSAVFISF
jgi:hypothetical protein